LEEILDSTLEILDWTLEIFAGMLVVVGTAFEEEELAFDNEEDLGLATTGEYLDLLIVDDEEDLWTLA
jgi:hypothetical protein